MKTMRRLSLAAGLGLLVAASAAVQGAEPEDIIKYRQEVMKSNGAHMAAAAAIIRAKVDFKGDLAYHAAAIRAINKDVAALFPKDSDFGDTEALDAVWKKNAEFRKRAQVAAEKSEAFAKAVAAGDSKNYWARFNDLNDACKACHKDFRKKQQ
jgi:cytochrome c556